MALVHCRECGEMISETAPTCPKCGASQRVFNSTPTEDKPNIGLNIVSFLWPIIGLIFYIVFGKETPKRAKDCGKWALIGAGSTVIRDVKDHAIMVGVPARQIGWACEWGNKLNPDLKCGKCQREYKETQAGLVQTDNEEWSWCNSEI